LRSASAWGSAGDKRFGSQESASFFDLQIAKNNTTKQDLRINDYLAIPPLQVLLSPTERFLVAASNETNNKNDAKERIYSP